MQTGQTFFITDRKQFFSCDKIYQFVDKRILFIDFFGTVSTCLVQIDDILWFSAENINILLANQIRDLHICSIFGSQRQRAI